MNSQKSRKYQIHYVEADTGETGVWAGAYETEDDAHAAIAKFFEGEHDFSADDLDECACADSGSRDGVEYRDLPEYERLFVRPLYLESGASSSEIFFAEFQTRNFKFWASGRTEDECSAAMIKALTVHCQQYENMRNLPDLLGDWDEEKNFVALPVNGCRAWRDHEELHAVPHSAGGEA